MAALRDSVRGHEDIRRSGRLDASEIAYQESCARNERPVRGDNRTGQAIWALGVDGRSRRIQPRWGGITAPTIIGSRQGRRTFKPGANFFNFLAGVSGASSSEVKRVQKPRQIKNLEPCFASEKRPWTGTYCAARRLPSAAGLSPAMAAAGTFNARVAGAAS